MTLLVTGGAGFIGSHFVRTWLAENDEPVVNLDALTYAGQPGNLAALAGDARHSFVHGDICDRALVGELLARHRVRAIVHLAAETHVDRSIAGPEAFVRSNVEGTFTLLEAVRDFLPRLDAGERARFRFLHVSTDEVYGSLGTTDAPADEARPYRPANPYSASKAAADHLVQAWHNTYGLPTLLTRCCNNYGPGQLPEKLMPLAIRKALAGQTLPLYGDGTHSRDWLHVADHCRALRLVLARGVPGASYNIGARNEWSNLHLVHKLCAVLDDLRPDPAGSYARLIRFVADRPGHDRRYAIDPGRIERELGWRAETDFDAGLRATVRSALDPWTPG